MCEYVLYVGCAYLPLKKNMLFQWDYLYSFFLGATRYNGVIRCESHLNLSSQSLEQTHFTLKPPTRHNKWLVFFPLPLRKIGVNWDDDIPN